MQNCIICNEPTKLNRRATNKVKYNMYCSSKCVKTAYRITHKERDLESKKKWILNNPEKRKQASEVYR